ncbi:transposase family protein [Actinacidiphila sp. bgisy160]|uniref:transposase family protein n=1 Tax=Actinacidiphila sp. bgisy160 TaxID=3413796 RepID=UPI003D752667
MFAKLGPLDLGRVADLRPFLNLVPDPRARKGRWYSLTAILLVCACAAVSGARTIDEIAEWAARASEAVLTAVGVRRHPLRWRRSPSRTTIARVLAAVDEPDVLLGSSWLDPRRHGHFVPFLHLGPKTGGVTTGRIRLGSRDRSGSSPDGWGGGMLR